MLINKLHQKTVTLGKAANIINFKAVIETFEKKKK